MLERATACAEPRVSLFLRQLENPTRSRRALHPSFWRNGAEARSSTAWWPAYLQDVRDIPLVRPSFPQLLSNTAAIGTDNYHNSFSHKPFAASRRTRRDITVHAYCRPNTRQRHRRDFSLTTRTEDGVIADSIPVQGDAETRFQDEYQDIDAQAPAEEEEEATQRALFHSGGPVNMPMFDAADQVQQSLPPAEALRVLIDSEEKDAYGRAWQLFVRTARHEDMAGAVVEYLSTSQHRVDLDHAIRAYRLTPAADRTLSNYQAVIKAACRRRQHRLAVEIHHETIDKGFHEEVTNSLLGFLVRNGLWKTASQVWDRLPMSRKNAGDPRNHSLWQETDQDLGLPARLLQLIKRLEHNAAIFASERDQIFALAVQLLYRIFSSSEIMANITGTGTSALLDECFYVGLLKDKHYFSGIQTLNTMKGARNRDQLATLLYRNLNMRFPNARLPRSVLGSLLAILCESDGNHLASRVILRRFATDWGKADQSAYLRVLSACARNGDDKSVHEVFDEYCEIHGRPTDLAFLTPLLYANARLGNVSGAQEQFDRLHSHFGLEPNTYCWNILIAAHARARDPEGAFQTFKKMRVAGIRPDQHTLGTLMGICASSGDAVTVKELVEMARREGVGGTIAMVDSLVEAYCRNDEIEEAEDLVETATKIRLSGSRTRMWNILLRHYAFRADTDSVLRIQERMKELSVEADAMTYAALMQSLVVLGKTKAAASILRDLHVNNHVTATVFHYSIILYGYALENKRDMVAVIFNEMSHRFPRVGLSAKLSRLRTQVYRDLELHRLRQNQALQGRPTNEGAHLSHTLDYLAQILLEVNQTDLATKDPQPGLGRRSALEAYPNLYLEFLIATLGRTGAVTQAQNLLARYLALIDSKVLRGANSQLSINLLTSYMTAMVRTKRFGTMNQVWNKVLSLAIQKGRRRSLDLSDPIAEPAGFEPPSARPEAMEISLSISDETEIESLRNPFLERRDIKILPAYKYILSAPLTLYMYALSAQNLAATLTQLVARLEEMGFSLTSKNWNHYVQVLAYSKDADLQVQSFRVFEEKLLPSLPPWHLMKRSKWAKRMLVDGSNEVMLEEPVSRKFIERFQPHTLVPTYWTMVYLGLALMKAQKRGMQGKSLGVAVLRSHAPGTVNAVSRMPYLRDKVQGLLLRGRTLQGELQKRPRRPPKVDRAGLRGSRSPLDHIPLDFSPQELDSVLKKDDFPSGRRSQEQQRKRVQTAEKLSGEIHRTPLVLEGAGRYEHEPEYIRRLQYSVKEKLRLLDIMTNHGSKSRLMTNDEHGDLPFEASLLGKPIGLSADRVPNPHSKEKKELLKHTIQTLKDAKRDRPRLPSGEPDDTRPAALLSAARRPKAAERLHLIRRRGRRKPAIAKSRAFFRRGIQRKIKEALITRQTRVRIPNRLRTSFRRNRAFRARKRRMSRSL
jgi:pentatricopeptide repeat-containing protein PET309